MFVLIIVTYYTFLVKIVKVPQLSWMTYAGLVAIKLYISAITRISNHFNPPYSSLSVGVFDAYLKIYKPYASRLFKDKL